ncbi:MAG: arginine--tRNA ligase [Desulfurococcales archaeon]|nr:arginine--tRNA ligase [Desulfurococcales archaeon]
MDPYTKAFDAIVDAISEVIGEDRRRVSYLLAVPSRREYGDLSFPAIRYVKSSGLSAEEIAVRVREILEERGINYVGVSVLKGYLNFTLDVGAIAEKLAGMAGEKILEVPRTGEPLKIVVEHTSANPIHPLHMGHARNTCLGDTLSRMLMARGHNVNRRFYVDDVGKQVAVAALGVKVLGIDPMEEAVKHGLKPDHLVGWIYAATHTIIDIKRLKKAAGEAERDEDKRRIMGEIEDLMSVLADLESKDPAGYFNRLLEGLSRIDDPEKTLSEMMIRYEKGLEPERTLIRGVATTVLEGFKQTLARLDVEFDAWDWESSLVWEGLVERVLEEARRSPYFIYYKGAEALDLPRFIRERVKPDPELRRHFRLPRGFEIPPLILRRSDGTTLYTTRDIAYSIYKFEVTGADKVYNVVGAEQRLSQLQVRLALAAIGYTSIAINMVHYDYELVTLPRMKMSSRRGRIVVLDDILETLRTLAEEEVEKRNPGAPRDWVRGVAEKIAVGALRFRMVQTSPQKPLLFDIEKALDLAENSGPYLQYTYARASSILRKLGANAQLQPPRRDACESPKRRELILQALRTPRVAAKAADDLAPEDLAVHLLKLADLFNSWYQEDPVIREPDVGARSCKTLIVYLVREALSLGLGLLGVPVLERM